MTEHDDGSVSVHGLRFVPLMMRTGDGLARVPEMFALPGGGRAPRCELPEIARRLADACKEARRWT